MKAILNTHRRGPLSLADFYAAELLYDDRSTWHQHLMTEVLRLTRKIILDDAAYCIARELRHADLRIYGDVHVIKLFLDLRRRYLLAADFGQWFRIHECIRINGGKRNFTETALKVFEGGTWEHLFGGDAWAEICRRTLGVIDESPENHRTMCVALDMLIDSCHNTGHSLNKLQYHRDSNLFLKRKTNELDTRWLIRMAQPAIQEMQKSH